MYAAPRQKGNRTLPGTIEFERIPSRVLAANPLGDPASRTTPVYLPPGYADSNQRYPAIFLLSGFSSRGLGMLNDSLWDENIKDRLDRLIHAADIPPVVVVMPDCSTRYGGSQYLNSSATGRYNDYLLELVAYIDQKYRTIPDRRYRAVCGISSGGYGATIMGMIHPETFSLVADLSGDKYFELCYKPDFPRVLNFYGRAGIEGLNRILADPAAVRPRGPDFFAVLNVSAMAACYSPNPASRFGFDYPFDLQTGRILPEVWSRWESHDPVYLVHDHAESLRSLKLLYLECGLYDEYNLQYGARIFATELEKHNIPFEFNEFEDGHRGLSYRYDIALKKLTRALPE
jgi:enterochelin esterase family protein